MRISKDDRRFQLFAAIVLFFALLLTLYPFLYVFSMSVSRQADVLSGKVWLFPRGFSLQAYKLIFENPNVIQSYYNTVWYTAVGTFCSLFITTLGAYALSRKEMFANRIISVGIIFTMYFSGGMIPTYIVVRSLGVINTRWAMVLPSLVATWNFLVCRTFFKNTIPDSIIESAKIDGANDIHIFFRIVLPTSTAILAVMVLFYAVDRWNAYFQAVIYLSGRADLQPIQIFLSRVLAQNNSNLLTGEIIDESVRTSVGVQLKYSLIIVTMLPIMVSYPLLQRYFVKGVMIGAVKE